MAYFSLGNLYLLNNDNEKAKEYYGHCLRLNYEISKVYNNLGQVYENLKKLEVLNNAMNKQQNLIKKKKT